MFYWRIIALQNFAVFCQTSAWISHQFSSVQSLSHVRLFVTPWITARQASLSITNSWSSLRLMSIESVMPSSHLILCCPLFLLPPVPPSIRVFSNESALCLRWPKYWSFSFSIIPSKEHWNMYNIIYEMNCQSRFNAWDRVLRAGALGGPWGMGWGGRWEGDSECETHVCLWLISVDVWQKPLQYCKVISLQL